MRANASEGWLEFLYKPKGNGLETAPSRQAGEVLSVLAPIGRGFTLDPARPRLLALGGGVGIPPMIFLADQLRARPELRPLVLMGSEVPFPFELVELAAESRACRQAGDARGRAARALGRPVAAREQRRAAGLPSRLHHGPRARLRLQAMTPQERAETQCSRAARRRCSKAVAKLARDFDLPCQVALEEFMACGIGGCAGCNVLVHTADGPAMKRVCVDGPVFDAREVYPA